MPTDPPTQRAFPCAQLSVIRGHSERRAWPLFEDASSRLVIGSSSLCDWRVNAPGVRPRHWRLSWNGERATIADQCEPGAVQVDGNVVGHRLELMNHARVAFGEALVVFERLPANTSVTCEAFTPVPTAKTRRVQDKPWRSVLFGALAFVTLWFSWIATR